MTGGSYDDVVIGAGIVGLAHAYHLARRGRRVLVIERHPRAQGASVRNFGMLWPIGQPNGDLRLLALYSRTIWLDVLTEAGIWHDKSGSLHVAYADDEARVLTEFAQDACRGGFPCKLLESSGRSETVHTAQTGRAAGGALESERNLHRSEGNLESVPALAGAVVGRLLCLRHAGDRLQAAASRGGHPPLGGGADLGVRRRRVANAVRSRAPAFGPDQMQAPDDALGADRRSARADGGCWVGPSAL